MEPRHLSASIKSKADELGFTLCGICSATTPSSMERFDAWLNAGYAGQMHYLADRREAYQHPKYVLEGVRSIVMLALPYETEQPNQAGPGEGRVSRYAWGEIDYHNLIRDRLHTLADYVRDLAPDAQTRGVVDTAPLLEREFAQLAGLGWIGKNTLLISKHAGSYFFLAALLTDQELAYDEPHLTDHCGTCTACLEACPTDAFVEPYVLDATRCISYLTIELQDVIPAQLRTGMGEWVFGCDVCQEVCPWNRSAPRSPEQNFLPTDDLNPLQLAALFDLDEQSFRDRFRKTPLWRAHRRGLLRNAAIVLGNQGCTEATEALRQGLSDEEPLVRGACVWALAKIGGEECMSLVQTHRSVEKNAHVLAEIDEALRLG